MYQFVGLLDTQGILLEANRASLDLGGVTLSSVVGKPFWEALSADQQSGGARIIGKRPEEIQGKTDAELFPPDIAAAIRASDREIVRCGEIKCLEDIVNFQGIRRTYLSTRCPLRDYKDAFVGVVGIAHDITERKSTEERLSFLAHHDALTNLPNRALLYDRMGMVFSVAARQSSRVAILFLDLDKLKMVNDSLGYSVGDQLIVAVASRLKLCIRAGDSVARLSGDEFVLVLPEMKNREDAANLVKKLLAAIAVPYSIGPNKIVVTATVGISFMPPS
jgi:diguanylate cyclase (GGDEF)-like protein/PAS domain S-box-containing protein